MQFADVVLRSRKDDEKPYQGTLLSFDPGHTTGWCIFQGTSLLECGQLDTDVVDDASLARIQFLIEKHDYSECIFEDYRVYKWKLQQHSFSELHTPKLIGMIQAACLYNGIEYHKQPASVAKDFCTDDRLKEWNMYITGQRHARDAIRHACWYILFGDKASWHTRKGRTGGTTVG